MYFKVQIMPIPKMKTILQIFLLFNFSISIFGQSLLKDIKTDNGSSHPREFTTLANGTSFFLAKTNNNENAELWKTDGTNAGTAQVKNPENLPYGPYFNNSLPSAFFAWDNLLLFSATDGPTNNYNRELWISDGTNAGTHILKEIYPGTQASNPRNFFILGSKVLFAASDNINGEELWITDGTVGGTQLVKNIYSGNFGSAIQGFTLFQGNAYFYATSDLYGRELWKTDGTTAGTVVLTDGINPSTTNTIDFGQELPVASSNIIYFPINSIVYGKELGYSDGINVIPFDLNGGYGDGNSNPKELTLCNNKVYFTATRFNNPRNIAYIDEFGQANGISGAQESDPKDLRVLNNVLIYTAVDFNNKRKMYRFEELNFFSQRELLKDINPTISTGEGAFPTDIGQRKFFVANSKIYFIANNGISGFEIWKTDGTNAGTSMIKDQALGSGSSTFSYFQLFDDELFYICNDELNVFKARKTNGTLEGTFDVESINPALGLSNVYPISKVGTKFYFTGFNTTSGYELYKLELGVTSLVKDIKTNGTTNYNNFNTVTENGNAILFNYDDGKHGMELWKTDGTSTGTSLFADLNPYPVNIKGGNSTLASFDFYLGSSYLNTDFVSFGGKTYFYANPNLMVTDGITLPTVFHANAAYYTGPKYGIKEYAGFLYFTVNSELWVTNGSYEFKLKTIDPSGSGTPLSEFNVCNGKLFFLAFTQANGEEIWVTDGTGTGTQVLQEMIPGLNPPCYCRKFEVVGNTLFFTFPDPVIGSELWKSDGTSAGTVLVKDINLSSGSWPFNLTNFNNQYLVFGADDGDNGSELWKSDGTSVGTTLIKDLFPGIDGSNPTIYNNARFPIFENKLYFSAYDASSLKYSVTDLTTNGTQYLPYNSNVDILATPNVLIFSSLVAPEYGYEPYFFDGNSKIARDIYSGTASSNSRLFYNAKMRKLIMFVANNGINGPEIHVIKDCRLNKSLTGNQGGISNTTVNGTISSTNKLLAGSSTEYFAGSAIELKPGFETTNVSRFTSKIEGCAYSTAGPPPGVN